MRDSTLPTFSKRSVLCQALVAASVLCSVSALPGCASEAEAEEIAGSEDELRVGATVTLPHGGKAKFAGELVPGTEKLVVPAPDEFGISFRSAVSIKAKAGDVVSLTIRRVGNPSSVSISGSLHCAPEARAFHGFLRVSHQAGEAQTREFRFSKTGTNYLELSATYPGEAVGVTIKRWWRDGETSPTAWKESVRGALPTTWQPWRLGGTFVETERSGSAAAQQLCQVNDNGAGRRLSFHCPFGSGVWGGLSADIADDGTFKMDRTVNHHTGAILEALEGRVLPGGAAFITLHAHAGLLKSNMFGRLTDQGR